MITGDRNATTIVLHANHRDLVRFPTQENENYKATLYYLKDHFDSALAAVGEKWTIEDSCRSWYHSYLCAWLIHTKVQRKGSPRRRRSCRRSLDRKCREVTSRERKSNLSSRRICFQAVLLSVSHGVYYMDLEELGKPNSQPTGFRSTNTGKKHKNYLECF